MTTAIANRTHAHYFNIALDAYGFSCLSVKRKAGKKNIIIDVPQNVLKGPRKF